MKHALIILVLLACNALAQNAAVTKNSNTEVINGDIRVAAPNYLMTSGPLMAHTQSLKMFGAVNPLSWMGYDAHFSVFTDSAQHGLVSESTGAGGIPIIGKSSSNGASAGKFVQTSTPPDARSSLYVGRELPYPYTGVSSPVMRVEGGSIGTNDATDRGHVIASFTGGNFSRLDIYNDGFVTAPGVMAAYPHHMLGSAVMTYDWGLNEFKNTIIDGVIPASAAATALTTATVTNLAGGTGSTVTLTPGTWDVWGVVIINTTAPASMGLNEFGIHTTATAMPAVEEVTAHVATWVGSPLRTQTNRRIITVAATTTQSVFLNVRVTFSSGTVTARGAIKAMRIHGVAP